jgi:hypothetical protein
MHATGFQLALRIGSALAALLAVAACGAWPAARAGFEPLASPGDVPTLQSHRWRLDAATEASGRRIDALFPGAARGFALTFEDGAIVVDGGCNTMRGGYRLEADGRLVVGRLAATMKGCEPALMQADAALARRLAEPLQAGIARGAAPRVRLSTASGDVLLLAGELTPEARYGPPTIVFLEVAARRVPCASPAQGPACLQVRDRSFDPQGLPAGAPGAWRVLPDAIEGYAHREGERTVLRVKRFERSAGAGESSRPLLVLDLLVETEVVKP